MSAKDISRYLFQPQKHYSSVRMQQGRVILDSDWNESERIDDEEARRTLLDILCCRGTSNEGFRVHDVETTSREVPGGSGDVEFPFTSVATYDFSIGDGSFYLGGLRFEVGPAEESFLGQSDFLQVDADAGTLPPGPTVADLTDANGNTRTRSDLVYLRAWEQCVTAVEDSELRERALGGPDTSVRIRRTRRVEVLADTAPGCAEAFADLVARETAPRPGDRTGVAHDFDAAGCELRSKARLTVAPVVGGTTEDPCRPQVAGGFLGAENQTIRVELTATDRFIWGIDNAAPYYRVQVLQEDGRPVRIQFLTLPRDQRSQPLKGQAVEIHPWGALLPNREKVAELRGHLATVQTSYDPETRSLTISDPVPQAWLDWLDHPSHAAYQSARDPDGQKKYFYLRLWTGGSGDAAEPEFPFIPGTAVELAGTGLTVTLSGNGLPGDHWIIAARPHTPDVVVAWELMDQAPPAGTRFFLAPLATIDWSVVSDPDGETVAATVHDCRARFRPLCELRGCCTVTVGDGRVSRGDFQSVQDAVDSLPADGGEVCLLPGIHEARVTILQRRNIRIHGCGRQTVVTPIAEDRAAPIFNIVDSQRITLDSMDLVTLDGTAVVVGGSEAIGSTEIEVAHTRILAFLEGIRVESGTEVNLHHNRIRMLDRDGAKEGILLAAEDAWIERNDIGVVPADRRPPDDGGPGDRPDPTDPCADPERFFGRGRFVLTYLSFAFRPMTVFFVALPTGFRALGGIRVAAGSERVRILENQVHGGAGNGITLGGTVVPPVPGDGDGSPPVEVTVPRELSVGVTTQRPDGTTLGGIGLAFAGPTGTQSLVTDSSGFAVVGLEAGDYLLSATTPGYRIQEATLFDSPEFPSMRVVLIEVEPPAPPPAFLYEIEIDGNEIGTMGLSGVGVPFPEAEPPPATTPAQALARLLGYPVVGLEIHRNRVTTCLQAPFEGRLRELSRTRGFGGIALGVCEKVRISGNRIEGNGRRHLDPVCGIYVSFAEGIEAHHNRITDNGPRDNTSDADPDRGVRGGIVVLAASFGVEDLLATSLSHRGQAAEVDPGRPAARIHDNYVKQPLGQALRLLAVGPVSVAQNRLTTDVAGPDSLEVLAGSTLLMSAGLGRFRLLGNALFTDNQIHLGAGRCLTSQVLLALDDSLYADNQSVALAEGMRLNDRLTFFVHTMMFGETIRAADNRFIEPEREGPEPLASLVTQSVIFNNTNNNQADHCIFAANQDVGRPPLTQGNQVVDGAACPGRTVGVTTGLRTAAVFGYPDRG